MPRHVAVVGALLVTCLFIGDALANAERAPSHGFSAGQVMLDEEAATLDSAPVKPVNTARPLPIFNETPFVGVTYPQTAAVGNKGVRSDRRAPSEGDDQLPSTWLMDGDVVYAATRSRNPSAPIPHLVGVENSRANIDDDDDRDHVTENAHSIRRNSGFTMAEHAHRRRRVVVGAPSMATSSSSSLQTAASAPTLEDLVLVVTVEETDRQSGKVVERVVSRVDAAIGNVPIMDDSVGNKIAVVLAVVVTTLTFFVVVIV